MAITNDEELAQAVEEMRTAGTDLGSCELKSGAGGFPRSTADTLSSFANAQGGVVIFGISEKGGFHAVRDLDVKQVQTSCAQAAREQIEPPLAVDIRVLRFEGSSVVVMNVPELPPKRKPAFVKKLGRMNGSFIRTGDGDHKLSLYEIDRFIENQQRSAGHDSAVVAEADLDDLDPKLLAGWLAQVQATTLGRGRDMDDKDLMANRRVIAKDEHGAFRPTLAGLLTLGQYPQKFFPRLNVVFTRYPTSRKGEPGASGSRFLDALNIDGPIADMIVHTVEAVSRNMKHGAIVRGALREDIPDYPLAAVREAIANALMHRDYSVEGRGTPVLVDMYPDRLEVSNPGGLFGMLTVEQLGAKGGTASRNQFLARILEDAPYTDYDGRTGKVVENRGSGYPTIMGELERALLSKPVILNSLAEFDLIFRHRRMTEQEGAEYSRANVEAAILDYFASRESAGSAELARAAGLSRKTVIGYLARLTASGIIEAIGPKNSPKRRYRLSK